MKRLAQVLVAIGVMAFGYWTIEVLRGLVYQTVEMRRFQREPVPQRNPDKPSPFDVPKPAQPPRPTTGSAVAVLAIPRLGVSTLVVEGAGERELKLGPGHISGTPLPGLGGNVGFAGHRDTFFRALRLIRNDDEVEVRTQERQYHYKVVSTKVVGPRDIKVLYPATHEVLTLVTCYPFDFIGRAPERFIVRADCVDCLRTAAPEAGELL